jgi:hypothetical protein
LAHSHKHQLSQKEIKKRLDSGHIVVNEWESLHGEFGKMSDTAWIFRGVSSPQHYPIPAIGREGIYGPYKRAQEERLFEEFKYRAVALVRDTGLDDWNWLAYAQHLGVPTRLLDWTTSPLVATFFALQGDADSDRAVYCVKYSRFIHEVERINHSPFENEVEGRYSPPLVFDRIRAQRGVFTVHPVPTRMFYQQSMRLIVIPRKAVDKLRKRLFKYGIDHFYVYPDAEGLGQQLKWHYRSKIGLGSIFMNDKTPKI